MYVHVCRYKLKSTQLLKIDCINNEEQLNAEAGVYFAALLMLGIN